MFLFIFSSNSVALTKELVFIECYTLILAFIIIVVHIALVGLDSSIHICCDYDEGNRN